MRGSQHRRLRRQRRDGDLGMGEDALRCAVAADRREADEEPGGMADGAGQAGVAVELGLQAGEGLGAGVVL